MPTTAQRSYQPISAGTAAFPAPTLSPGLRVQPRPGVRDGQPETRPATPRPSPPRSAPQSAPRPRARVQTGWLLAMVFLAIGTVVVGLAYLSGYAQVTQEGFRQAKLKQQLANQKELLNSWKQRLATTNSPSWIEHLARARGMYRADDKNTLTVGQKGVNPGFETQNQSSQLPFMRHP